MSWPFPGGYDLYEGHAQAGALVHFRDLADIAEALEQAALRIGAEKSRWTRYVSVICRMAAITPYTISCRARLARDGAMRACWLVPDDYGGGVIPWRKRVAGKLLQVATTRHC